MSRIRIAFDARMHSHGGIGTYIGGLLHALSQDPQFEHGCLLGANGLKALSPHFCERPWRAPIYSLREQVFLPSPPHRAALWHSPHFNVPLRWRGGLVVTIHDLIHVKFPRVARTRWASGYARVMLRYVARRAQAVIAVSETTKRDFCDYTQADPGRVVVIPHGVDPAVARPVADEERSRILERYGIHRPFLLWVSAIRPHKNPLIALKAFARLRTEHRIPHQLVMVGSPLPWYSAPQEESNRLGLMDAVRWVGAVPPSELPALYQTAEALIAPSTYEGFGLAALEAMAAGLPVVCSSTPALSELVENAGLTVSPDDVDLWVASLYNVLVDGSLRRTLRERGRARARNFTWERCAQAHLRIYSALVR